MDDKGTTVLVGCITSAEHAFCLDSFWSALCAQDFGDFKVIFAEISGDEVYRKRLLAKGAQVINIDGLQGTERIFEGRRIIKEVFLDKSFEYLLLIDTDIILPPNGISRLMFHKKDIISGTYLSNMKLGDKHDICPCIYDFADEGFVRVLELKEVIDDRLIEIACSGLGCILLSKKAMKNVPMSLSGAGTDDVAFFITARNRGFDAFADTAVKCNRMVRSEGDPVNNLFSFDAYPKIRRPRVLVGCVTHDKDSIYLKGFIDGVRSQDYTNYDLIFAETSANPEFIATLRGSGAIVIEVGPEDHAIKNIRSGREIIREYAIKNNYDYLLFVDTDVIPPQGALSRLLASRKDIVAGVCLSWMNVNGTPRVMPNVYDFADEKDFCRPMWLNEVLNDNLVEVSCAGFGCTLATRSVLEKVSMRYYEKSMAGEDIAFFVDARKAGFRAFADNSVKCRHLVFPPGDPRNRKLMFESYQKGETYSIKIDNNLFNGPAQADRPPKPL